MVVGISTEFGTQGASAAAPASTRTQNPYKTLNKPRLWPLYSFLVIPPNKVSMMSVHNFAAVWVAACVETSFSWPEQRGVSPKQRPGETPGSVGDISGLGFPSRCIEGPFWETSIHLCQVALTKRLQKRTRKMRFRV